MTRALSLWMPAFSTDLAQRRLTRGSGGPREPMLLASLERGQRVVMRRCARCARAGVHVGMTVAQALALLPSSHAHVEDFDANRERAALHRLALWAQRFSPIVAPDPPDGLLLDIAGCAHLFGSEAQLADSLRASLARRSVQARTAIAPTFGAAWALARFGEAERIVNAVAELPAALAPLPIEALRLDAETSQALREVGVERVGQLLDLPRAAIPARFGEDALLRLDQALGCAVETIEPVRSEPPLRVERVFEGATTNVEGVALAAQRLLDSLAAELRRREAGVMRLAVRLHRLDAEDVGFTVALSRPSHDATHLWSLLAPKLEQAHLGFGVEALTLIAQRVKRIPHEQHTRWRESDAPSNTERDKAWGALVDYLRSRLGEQGVAALQAVESHIPERAFQRIAPERRPSRDEASVAPADRPIILLDHPEPIEVVALTPDGPIVRFSWRREDRRVAVCVGPERLEGEWWRMDRTSTRDYFKAQDEHGQWLWVFRQFDPPAWRLHGLWA